jgi:hypothetical protein
MAEEKIIGTDQRISPNLNQLSKSIDQVGAKNPIDMLLTEGGEGFYQYVDWLGLAKDDNLVVLSSLHHYYYDADEMNNVKTLVNLKELNQIKQVENLLNTCLHILPTKSNFIGCFVNGRKTNRYALKQSSSPVDKEKDIEATENSIVSKFPLMNMLYSFMDSKINTFMSRTSVSSLLEDHGFTVINMTEVNGLTFFLSQKNGRAYN